MRYAILVLAACGGNGDGGNGIFDSDASLPTMRGYLFIQSYDAMNVPNMPTRGGSAAAGFFMTASANCAVQKMGPCDVSSCVGMVQMPDATAGTITITGAAMPLTLTANADKTYTSFTSQTTPLFAGGETVTFAAAGADVPAFTTTLTMPAKAAITSPAEPPASSPYLIINRATDFTVRWTGGGTGTMQVALFGPNATPSLLCKFPATALLGTVPSTVLSMVPAGMGSFAMASIAEKDHTAGDYGIDVSAYFNAVWPDASIVSGPTTFQ